MMVKTCLPHDYPFPRSSSSIYSQAQMFSSQKSQNCVRIPSNNSIYHIIPLITIGGRERGITTDLTNEHSAWLLQIYRFHSSGDNFLLFYYFVLSYFFFKENYSPNRNLVIAKIHVKWPRCVSEILLIQTSDESSEGREIYVFA